MRVHVSLKADDEATAGGNGDGPASFSWATMPTAFHGANMSGDYRPDQIAQLAKYDMVTIEKWQGACAAQHARRTRPLRLAIPADPCQLTRRALWCDAGR